MIRTLPTCVIVLLCSIAHAQSPPELVEVEGQPLAANVLRLLDALEFTGSPLPPGVAAGLRQAAGQRDARKIQETLDAHVLLAVHINPEARVKVQRGPLPGLLQQAGYTPVIIKVINEAVSTAPLRVISPQAGPVYAGVAASTMRRQQQTHLRENENVGKSAERFLDIDLFRSPPMTARLSGLEVEYALISIYSAEAGRREATIGFDLGDGNQDLGFRGETPVLFTIRPAVEVKLSVRDAGGEPTTARLVFRDERGHVYPPQIKRLAPDLFFQEQVYRADGQTILLPPGRITVESSRGPEYIVQQRTVEVPAQGSAALEFRLERWVNPMAHGYYGGDHHIHAAGCAHYSSPTDGVDPEHVFPQIKGEGLNVGSVLTWGPCFEYQRRFFSEKAHGLSEPLTLMKYDLEISGFGSAGMGHTCLLNLKELLYPGARGTAEGWPRWNNPALKWAKQQGGVTGYAHSASGMWIHAPTAARRLMAMHDTDNSGALTPAEVADALLPYPFEQIDLDRTGRVTEVELAAAAEKAADELPNWAVPGMMGAGAMEICVSVAEGVCDFISSMDTRRIQEWNTWYHLLNCGFPLKTAGETDFPCMSGTRVGQGRTYVYLGPRKSLDYADWCGGLRDGRSYVSDGYAHALGFTVDDQPAGGRVELTTPGKVRVKTIVAFAPRTPLGPAYGTMLIDGRKYLTGDTVEAHGPMPRGYVAGGKRLVELVVNGKVVARREVEADGQEHALEFTAAIERSSWVAVRQFPQMHTNPVDVIVAGQPIRASRRSALWCARTIELLAGERQRLIPADQREEALATFQRAIEKYRRIAGEAKAD